MNTTIFGFLLDLIFGKRFMYYQIKRTLKNTLFAEEMDLAFRKASYDSALSRKKLLEQNLKELEEKPLDLAVDRLPEELKSDAKAIYDEDRKIEKERLAKKK